MGDCGIRMFDNLRKTYQLRADKDLLLLRMVAESWELMVNTSRIINDSDSEGPKPYSLSKDAKQQLMIALKELLWRMK